MGSYYDLRVQTPFPQLQALADTYDLNALLNDTED